MKSLATSTVSLTLLRRTTIIALAAFIGAVPVTTIATDANGGQAQSQTAHTPAQTQQGVLLAPKGSKGATCTSTDGHSSCVCGGKCQATASGCSCLTAAPGKGEKPQTPLPLAAPGGALKATCTSGDGKTTCACRNSGCSAGPASCGCLTK